MTGTTSSKPTHSRVGTLAKTACVACRRLKMKCVGAQNPPCARCSKVGRKCVIPPVMAHHQIITPYSSTEDIVALASHQKPRQLVFPLTPVVDSRHDAMPTPQWDQHHDFSKMPCVPSQPNGAMEMHMLDMNTAKQQHWNDMQRHPMSALPTSYSYPSLVSLDVNTSIHYIPPPITEVNISSVSVPATPLHQPRSFGCQRPRSSPSDEELSHLCRFFIMNLLVYIPILAKSDVGDFAEMVKMNKRPLAYSMAYVAARFVPGCRSIRAMLVPEILSMLKIRYEHAERGDDERWMLLQAFAVLYTWASPQDIERSMNSTDDEVELSQDALRASMEMLALRWSLHRSGEEVVRLTKEGGDIRQTFAFRKYCYWLWMFSSAHFHSLLSRTPPTIREDATIRWANQNLQQYSNDESTLQILAEVDLSLLWIQKGANERNAGEWWCPISNETDLTSTMSVLKGLDDALNVWYQRWHRQNQHPSTDFAVDPGRSSSIDFHHRFTRFCFSTHVTKLSQSLAPGETVPLSVVDLIVQSVERASTLCDLFLDLTPLAKSSIRFAPESTFAMMAFACEWVIRAKNFFPGMECVKPHDLDSVRGVAELMVDLGIDNKHSARVYGESILTKLNTATRPSPSRSSTWSMVPQEHKLDQQTWAPATTPTPHPMGSRALIESVTAMDGVWPLRSSPIQRPHSTGPQLGLAITSGDGSEVFSNYNGSEYFHFDPTWSI
ncbi:hypothetical protein PV11_05034 [Exophiala sideris]|uniref:Zn(2)-C6 fungal-type domain-containing protein n=1 Tax=Exophiala sideris TaxID=1016849 RepID=A0A0D1YJB0_9EURO|nr:hypothetical protein PV11_05034 [Exophiala sideris]